MLAFQGVLKEVPNKYRGAWISGCPERSEVGVCIQGVLKRSVPNKEVPGFQGVLKEVFQIKSCLAFQGVHIPISWLS